MIQFWKKETYPLSTFLKRAIGTGIKLLLTRSKFVQLHWNQWLYDNGLIHVCMCLYICVNLSAFYSPCAGIIAEDSAYSARAEQGMCFVTDCEVVGFLPK